MADTLVKDPLVIVGTREQVDATTVGENDFVFVTDETFYTSEEVDEKIIAIEGKIPTNASTSNLLSTADDLLNATQDVRADFAEADSELQTQINGQAIAITEAQGDIVDLHNNKQDVISDLDTIRSNASKGATAVQPSDLSSVATSGSYNDLTNKPTIPTVNNGVLTIQKNGIQVATFSANQSGNVTANIEEDTQVNADWNATSGVAQILNKPTLSTVSTSGSYNDLTDKPTIPSATSQLTNDSDYTTKNYVDTTEQEIIENYMQADTDLQTQITGLSTALTTAQGDITTINGKIPTSASSSNLLITNTELTNATQSVRSDFADADSELQTQITGLSGTVATNQTDIVNLKAQKYGADLSYADSQLQLLDQDGNALGNSVEISVDTSNAANIDLSNLSTVGQEILDNKLNKQMISNCITEIPQDIKLELNDGVLTLKAGSKVYVPNGFEEDGTTPKFDVVTIESDISRDFSTISQTVFVMITLDNAITVGSFHNTSSGDTEPSTTGYLFYNTSTNLLYDQNGAQKSFPFCIVSSGSVTQVFNGFGYIGSTVFALPGVKGLVPNGRNEDGSLNNIEAHTESVLTYTNKSGAGGERWYSFKTPQNGVWEAIDYMSSLDLNNGMWKHNEIDNIWTYNGNIQPWFPFSLSKNDTTSPYAITYFNPKNTFRAVDYNDFANTPHIVETYQNGTSWYRIYSDGWCEQGGYASSSNQDITITLLKPFKDTNYSPSAFATVGGSSTNNNSYISIITTTTFRFGSMIAKACSCYWKACGYIS